MISINIPVYDYKGDVLLTLPVLLDPEFIDDFSKYNWKLTYIDANWRVWFRKGKKRTYLHTWIWSKRNSNIDNLLIDHINRNSLDNRLCNLRLLSVSDNNKNRNKQKRKFEFVKESETIYNKKET